MAGDGIVDGDQLSARVTDRVKEGQLAIFSTPYGLTLKRGYSGPDDTVILRSSNPVYRDQVWQADEVKAIGVIDQQSLSFMWG